MADIPAHDHADAGASPDRGHRDDAHQRAQDLRHHPEHGSGLIPGRSEHPGAGDVQLRLYGARQLGPGQRIGRDPVHPGDPRNRAEPKADQGMSAVSPAAKPLAPATKPVTLRRRSPLSAIRPSRAILNIVLIVSAVFWLVPTIGLAIISLRPEAL